MNGFFSVIGQKWFYALACVTVPVLWGLAVMWASNRVERLLLKRGRPDRAKGDSDLPPLEFHI